jgi:putative hydrolase of the HAD superfamily
LSAIQAIFWDVGGVLLTNAWDHNERKDALEHFHLEEKEFQARHELVVSSFERGKITLEEYLNHTVFYQERQFNQEEFRDYMFSLSKPKSEVLDFARSLAESGRYLMSTINNESRELNDYRIAQFELQKIFRLFAEVPNLINLARITCAAGPSRPACRPAWEDPNRMRSR